MAGPPSAHRILVVDDDAMIRQFLHDFLVFQGHSVTLCEDAQRALALLEDAEFSLLITDVSMPGMTGVELVHELRSKDRELPVLVLSGTLDDEVEASLKRLGRTECLAKPFHTAQLLSVLDRLLTPI
jgi:CheY-like chemotaxis protein